MSLRTFRNVLLVDEDPAASGRLAEMLASQHQLNTTVVQVDSIESIRHFSDSAVDILLFDPCMRGAVRAGSIGEIKAIAPGVPLVVLTSLDQEGAAAKALQEGAQDYLIKGQIDPRGLVRSLNYAIERNVLEEALYVEKERAQITLNSIGDAVACTDMQGNLTYINPVAESLTRWRSVEALGRPMGEVFRIVRAENRANIPDPMEAALRLDRTVRIPEDSILVTRDEGEVPVEDSASPIHDRKGRPIGAVMVLRDVSASRTAAAHLSNSAKEIETQYALVNRINSELAAIVNSSPVAIYATDSEGLVTLWSPSAERITGFSSEDAVGRFLPIVPDPGIPKAKELVRDICRGQQVTGTRLSMMRKDGTALELSISAGPLIDGNGGTRGVIAIAEDITEATSARKKIERMQADFVATVSHELRTPLTSIGGSLGLIAGGTIDALSGHGARLIAIAYENTKRLSRLVNDILDIERLQGSQVEFDLVPTMLDHLVDQSITANLAVADDFNVALCRLGDPCDTFIMAAPDRVIQAITNLISNAIKFSPAGSHVDIATEKNSLGVRVSVDDFGPGIAVEFRPRLFERFAQDDSLGSRKKGGSGLGLSIVREIMQRHHGSVSFESEVGAGSTFYLQFPAIRNLDNASAQPLPSRDTKRVLVCASDEVSSNLICDALCAAGIECAAASNESQALAAASQGATRAAMISLPFGGSDLSDFIRSLRRHRKSGHLPVILLCEVDPASAYAHESMARTIVEWVDLVSKHENSNIQREGIELRARSSRCVILYVSNRPHLMGVLLRALSIEFRMIAAPTIGIALRSLHHRRFDLVIVDSNLLMGSGRELLRTVVEAEGHPTLAIAFAGSGSHQNPDQTMTTVSARSGMNLSILAAAVRSVLSKRHGKSS